MFGFIYFFLSVVLYIIALPLLIYLSFKEKYKESIPARFFLKNNPKFSKPNDIWFHVCSLGEARALKPLLDRLNTEVDITTITHTGYAEAKKYKAQVRYLPYETFIPFWATKHKLLVVLEAEFWYMLFAVLHKKGAKVVLLNARISDKSSKKYQKMAWFYKKLFAFVDLVLAQSEIDKARLEALGAKNVVVVGNIKLAQKIVKTKEYPKPSGEIIVAGSTHEGEEKVVLEAFLKYKKIQKDAKLIVVPRHPERFESVYELLQTSGLDVKRWSEVQNFDADIILVDAMGELNNIYAISDIAILGGAFREDVGGHNPLEPAHFGCKIITGKHFFHQKELFRYTHHVQYVETDEILKALQNAKDLPPSQVDETIDIETVIQRIQSYA
ncbi:MAG: 3-deoxy-D-manno-octulosonic acid transferase [Epsilonproteobacteria bacterium]|nr:3-deoxy-D-manno-octulosonic acid transferase [Campylobacterota bacterium]